MTYNPFEEKSVKDKANKTEKRLAKRLGGSRQPGSGMFSCMKGDVKTPELLIDSKETDRDSFSLTTKMLAKIEEESHTQRKVPAIVLKFNEAKLGMIKEWIVLPLEEYERLK